MPSDFPYDVFLSHSAKDKARVRRLAEQLRQDGLKVWFDEWVLKPGDSIPAKIEEGPFKFGTWNLELGIPRLCMSANAFDSDWAQLARPAVAFERRRKTGTFRFRDPLNEERRFIPLRLDDAPIRGLLAQFLHISRRMVDCEDEQNGPSSLVSLEMRPGTSGASRLQDVSHSKWCYA
jgi:hypothetical protein